MAELLEIGDDVIAAAEKDIAVDSAPIDNPLDSVSASNCDIARANQTGILDGVRSGDSNRDRGVVACDLARPRIGETEIGVVKQFDTVELTGDVAGIGNLRGMREIDPNSGVTGCSDVAVLAYGNLRNEITFVVNHQAMSVVAADLAIDVHRPRPRAQRHRRLRDRP